MSVASEAIPKGIKDKFKDLKKNKKYWLAGILEGEGCFTRGKGSHKNSINVTVAMTDKDIIERVASIIDRPIYTHKERHDWKTIYITRSNGVEAASLMKTIYSLMGKRRKRKIKEILDIWDPWRNAKAKAKLSDKEVIEIFYRANYNDETNHEIAQNYPVNHTSVSRIANGYRFQWIMNELEKQGVKI